MVAPQTQTLAKPNSSKAFFQEYSWHVSSLFCFCRNISSPPPPKKNPFCCFRSNGFSVYPAQKIFVQNVSVYNKHLSPFQSQSMTERPKSCRVTLAPIRQSLVSLYFGLTCENSCCLSISWSSVMSLEITRVETCGLLFHKKRIWMFFPARGSYASVLIHKSF